MMWIEILCEMPEVLSSISYFFIKFLIIGIILFKRNKIISFLKPAIVGKDGILDMREVVTVSLLIITFFMIYSTSVEGANVFPDIAWITILGGLLTSVGIRVYKEINKKDI